MKLKKKAGFTLIELLVVVLIIAILTAVAVPQYRKAVLKSRFSTLMPLAKNLWDSNEVFYLSNGGYAAGVDELDVSAPADPNVQVEVMDEENHQYVRVSNPNINNRITMYQKHSPNFPEETHCEALLNDDFANWLCKDSLQGTFVGNKFGYAVYTLSPEAVGTLARVTYNYSGNKTFSDGDVCVSTGNYLCASGGGKKVSYDTGSKCVAVSGLYGCDATSFSNGSACIGKAYSGCAGGKFDHSYCVGDHSWGGNSSCRGTTFKNYSICYANKKDTCTGSYDSTSCCYGSSCSQNKCEDNDYWKEHLDEIPPMPTYP